ncbi:hypothetical protein [Thermococcus sibiricus]|uniref:Uncharacterized protein n=1 Tax=Thermococcus sibiricus TaxID=172049 RepID=A0A117L0U9_9EURY|nr:hypothetical protein [Thermococcus sibiricus]KUK16659.1 MAG: Uncharacterized protein XD54_2050 [Thermococcus sibiricus]
MKYEDFAKDYDPLNVTEKETISYLREIFEYHLENTPYWKRMKEKVNLDEIFEGNLEDVFENIFNSNLAVSEDYLRNNWLDFLPNNYRGKVRFYQSSGTTRERGILHWDYKYMKLLVKYLKVALDEIYKLNKKYDESHNMRAITHGPYGWYQEEMSELVWSYNGMLYFIGIETDGIKRELKEKGLEYLLKGRLAPLVRYTQRILEKDKINTVRSAPQLLTLFPKVEEIETIIVSGVGVTVESLKWLMESFPNASVIPLYGYYAFGDLMGMLKNDNTIYFPNYPFTIAFPLKATHGGYTVVNRGESGKMGLIIARPELLVVKLEDEHIIRATPEKPFKWDGFANPKRIIG